MKMRKQHRSCPIYLELKIIAGDTQIKIVETGLKFFVAAMADYFYAGVGWRGEEMGGCEVGRK